MTVKMAVEILFKGQPWDQGKCPLNRGRAGTCQLITNKDKIKNHLQLISATLYVEFTQVQYFDFSDIVQFVKASIIIVIRVHIKISTLFMVSHFFSAKVSPEWRLNPGFGTQKVSLSPEYRCPFKRGNKCKDYVGIFASPEWRCPLTRGVPMERFYCI